MTKNTRCHYSSSIRTRFSTKFAPAYAWVAYTNLLVRNHLKERHRSAQSHQCFNSHGTVFEICFIDLIDYLDCTDLICEFRLSFWLAGIDKMKHALLHMASQLAGLIILAMFVGFAVVVYSGAPYTLYLLSICCAVWLTFVLFRIELKVLSKKGATKGRAVKILTLRSFRNLLILLLLTLLPLIVFQGLVDNFSLHRFEREVYQIEQFLLFISEWVSYLGYFWIGIVVLGAILIPLLSRKSVLGQISALTFRVLLFLIFAVTSLSTLTFFTSVQSNAFAGKVRFTIRKELEYQLSYLNDAKIRAVIWHKVEENEDKFLAELTKVAETALVAQSGYWALDEFRKTMAGKNLDFFARKSMYAKFESPKPHEIVSRILRGNGFSGKITIDETVFEGVAKNSRSLDYRTIIEVFGDGYKPETALEQIVRLRDQRQDISAKQMGIREVLVESTSIAISSVLPEQSPEAIKDIVGSASDAFVSEFGDALGALNTFNRKHGAVIYALETSDISDAIQFSESHIATYYEVVSSDAMEESVRSSTRSSTEFNLKYPHGFLSRFGKPWKAPSIWDSIKRGRIRF